VIAILGNLTHDLVPGHAPRVGGGPFHCARALQRLEVQATIYARCAEDDRDELIPQVVALGTPVEYVSGTVTAIYGISYEGDLLEAVRLWIQEGRPETAWPESAFFGRAPEPCKRDQ
jgi:hypothetical protein